MKKQLLFLALLFSFSQLYSQEKGNWKTWYENFLKSLKYKVEKKISPHSKVTAVAAVRGSKKEDKSQEVYWKGSNSKKAQEKIEADRKTLREAVELIVNGDIEKGRAQLKDFIARNPDSYFISEAKEALEKLPPEEVKPQESNTNIGAEENSEKEKVKDTQKETSQNSVSEKSDTEKK